MPEEQHGRRASVAWAIAFALWPLALIVVALLGFRFVTGTGPRTVINEGPLTSSFFEARPEQKLLLATLTEQSYLPITEVTSYKVLGMPIEGEATYFVEYKAATPYHVALDDRAAWNMRSEGAILHVVAPPLVAGEPAVDTSSIRVFIDGSWLVFGEVRRAQELREGLSPRLRRKAATAEMLARARPVAREALEDLLLDWAGPQFDGIEAVKVRFVDEGS